MITSLRARVQKLEAGQPSPLRRFIVVCSEPEDVDRALLDTLPGVVTLASTGVPPPYPPVIWEMLADGRCVLAEQDLAA